MGVGAAGAGVLRKHVCCIGVGAAWTWGHYLGSSAPGQQASLVHYRPACCPGSIPPFHAGEHGAVSDFCRGGRRCKYQKRGGRRKAQAPCGVREVPPGLARPPVVPWHCCCCCCCFLVPAAVFLATAAPPLVPAAPFLAPAAAFLATAAAFCFSFQLLPSLPPLLLLPCPCCCPPHHYCCSYLVPAAALLTVAAPFLVATTATCLVSAPAATSVVAAAIISAAAFSAVLRLLPNWRQSCCRSATLHVATLLLPTSPACCSSCCRSIVCPILSLFCCHS